MMFYVVLLSVRSNKENKSFRSFVQCESTDDANHFLPPINIEKVLTGEEAMLTRTCFVVYKSCLKSLTSF